MTAASPKPFSSPLYPIVDVDLCRARGLSPQAVARAFLAAGPGLLQVRQKSGGSAELLAIVRAAVGVAGAAAAILVNDRADIAAMAAPAGIHLGQTDLPPAEARGIVGDAVLCGVSTHTKEQIDAAVGADVDYLAVGPVYRTGTKETGYEPRGLDLERYAAASGKPVVAIGGITLERAPGVLAAGATAIAVISDLLTTGDPEGRAREYLGALS